MKNVIRTGTFAAALATAALGTWLTAGRAGAGGTLSGQPLVDALAHGGYVIVMRRASTATKPPQGRQASPGNPFHEPELDELGEATVEAMGYAFRKFAIPVDQTYTSPVFSAYQTAHYFGFGERHKVEELGTDHASAEWLRMQVRHEPAAGQNDLVVTQQANLEAAFGTDAAGLEPGEALVFKPEDGKAEIVGRMPIKDWAKLAVLGHT